MKQLNYRYSIYPFIMFLMLLSAFDVQSAQEHELSGTPITINGIDAPLKTNILRSLNSTDNLIPLSVLGFPQSDNYILNKARTALQALGYYQPVLVLADEPVNDINTKILTIELTSPVRWNQVNISLNCHYELTELSELLANHPFNQGKVINHGEYSQFKSALQRQANELGLLNASFSRHELNVDVEKLVANIDWVFDCGDRYTINEVAIDGTLLSHDLVNRYWTIRSGQNYNQANIIASQQALNRSGFFKSVVVEQTIDHATKTVDISLSIVDTEQFELKTLLGYGTDSGGKLGISWKNRRVNNKAHQYVAALDLNKVKLDKADINATFQYQIPLEKASSQWINLLSYQIKNEEIGRSKIFTLESMLANKINDHWTSQWSIVMAQEQLQSDADVSSSLEYIVPSWQLNYYSVTDPFSATQGWRWQSIFRFSGEQISDPNITFLQTDQRIKRIWSLNENWRVLLRARIGATLMETKDFNRSMPSNYRFFAGGDVSVRGYKHQSLSPVADSILLGGKHLIASSIELDYLFKEDFRWAIFTDQGNAFNDWQDWKLHKSIGTGLRWVTPVGAIRFDVAKALDGNKGWRVHITIGPDL